MAMNTCMVRYGAGAVLAAVAAGLLVSSGVAPAALGGSASVWPHSDTTACGYLASVRARGQLINAGECTGTPVSRGIPARGTQTYRAGRLGRAALIPDARGCLADHHLELREATRSCPVVAVTVP
jgi:hypothetical protein